MKQVTPGSVVVGMLDPGEWSASFGLSYRNLCLFDQAGPRRVIRQGASELRKVCGAGGIASARNEIAAMFLDDTDGEWLWFVDTDMGFAPDTVEQLIGAADKVERPVVGALCFAQKAMGYADLFAERWEILPTVYDYAEVGDELGFRPIHGYPPDKVVQVGGTGAACIVIHRSVLVKLRERFGDCWFAPVTHPTGDHGKPRTFSEDLSFCVRLAGADIPLHVHTGIKTSHHKGGIFLDEEMFARQQAFSAFETALNMPPVIETETADVDAD